MFVLMERYHELEDWRRSLVMLPPRSPALDREEAVRLIAELQMPFGLYVTPRPTARTESLGYSSISTAPFKDLFSYRGTVGASSRSVALVALVVLVCVLGFPSAVSAKNAPGSPKWCKHHPKTTLAACQKTGGAGTGSSPTQSISVSPNPVVETGGSDVYAVISVDTDPVFAQQTVKVVSALSNRCGQGVTWISDQGTFSGLSAAATIDSDGNATFTVLGASCAAGTVEVMADVEAGQSPTYAATFTIDPPAPSF